MKTMNLTLVGLMAAVVILTGCATQPVVLNTVGPARPAPTVVGSRGFLRIYTTTEPHELGKDTYYYTHSSYNVYDLSGNLVKAVPNHIGDMDQSPALVNLPTGKYMVKAQSDMYGLITVPIVIGAGETTDVHLASPWKTSVKDTNELVALPDGRSVGWKYPLDNSPY